VSGWRVLRLAESEPIPSDQPGVPDWTPLRHRLGVGAFGINAWTARAAGEPVVERHDELPGDCGTLGHEEVYLVLTGSADFTVDGERFPATAGTVVFLEDPSLVREAVAREPGTTVLAVGAPRGEAFTPSPWELRWLERSGAA
jgi:hypothetical protein